VVESTLESRDTTAMCRLHGVAYSVVWRVERRSNSRVPTPRSPDESRPTSAIIDLCRSSILLLRASRRQAGCRALRDDFTCFQYAAAMPLAACCTVTAQGCSRLALDYSDWSSYIGNRCQEPPPYANIESSDSSDTSCI